MAQTPRTLVQVQRQMAKLERDAERLKKAEAAGVIARIRVAIEAYALTPQDLFGGQRGKSAAVSSTAVKPKKSKSKLDQKAQFADGAGNEWVGRGPRPLWLREALAAGRSLSDFAVNRGKMKAAAKTQRGLVAQPKSQAKPKKNVVSIKYRDGDGNSWTGRGSQPRWLRTAIEGGKSIEQFLV